MKKTYSETNLVEHISRLNELIEELRGVVDILAHSLARIASTQFYEGQDVQDYVLAKTFAAIAKEALENVGLGGAEE